jgi:hypothetical protein
LDSVFYDGSIITYKKRNVNREMEKFEKDKEKHQTAGKYTLTSDDIQPKGLMRYTLKRDDIPNLRFG